MGLLLQILYIVPTLIIEYFHLERIIWIWFWWKEGCQVVGETGPLSDKIDMIYTSRLNLFDKTQNN